MREVESSSCCDLARSTLCTTYRCTRCGRFTCRLHAAIWTDGRPRCSHCFGNCLPVHEVAAPLILSRHRALPKLDHPTARILVVLDGLYIAGAQRHCIELIRLMRTRGVACTLLALDGGGMWADKFAEITEEIIVVTDYSLDWPDLAFLLPNIVFRAAVAHLQRPAKWLVDQVPIDVPRIVHFHSEPSEHETLAPQALGAIVSSATKVLVPSEATRAAIVRFLAEHLKNCSPAITVLPNALRETPATAPSFGIAGQDAMRIAVVSRIDNDKFSIPLFVDTLQDVISSKGRVQVVIAGDGDAIAQLSAALSGVELASCVHLLGFVSDIDRIYDWSTVVFLPSKRESLPYVLLESAAAARPIVVPALGILENVKLSGPIYTFRPEDAFSAAEALRAAATWEPAVKPWSSSPVPLCDWASWVSRVCEIYRL